jgi:hypothetical protein
MRIARIFCAALSVLVLSAGCSDSPRPRADASTDGHADAAADGPPCPGENPALKCRTSEDECLPSACGCTEDGWVCTADCGGGRLCTDGGVDAGNDGGVDAGSDGGGDAGNDGGGDAGLAQLCLATGGTIDSRLCCQATGDFPNSCSAGACGCAPANSHTVSVCTCPTGTCFSPPRGCLVASCTPGADQTCNDDPTISSLRGTCLPDHTCSCVSGASLNPATGKCR